MIQIYLVLFSLANNELTLLGQLTYFVVEEIHC